MSSSKSSTSSKRPREAEKSDLRSKTSEGFWSKISQLKSSFVRSPLKQRPEEAAKSFLEATDSSDSDDGCHSDLKRPKENSDPNALRSRRSLAFATPEKAANEYRSESNTDPAKLCKKSLVLRLERIKPIEELKIGTKRGRSNTPESDMVKSKAKRPRQESPELTKLQKKLNLSIDMVGANATPKSRLRDRSAAKPLIEMLDGDDFIFETDLELSNSRSKRQESKKKKPAKATANSMTDNDTPKSRLKNRKITSSQVENCNEEQEYKKKSHGQAEESKKKKREGKSTPTIATKERDTPRGRKAKKYLLEASDDEDFVPGIKVSRKELGKSKNKVAKSPMEKATPRTKLRDRKAIQTLVELSDDDDEDISSEEDSDVYEAKTESSDDSEPDDDDVAVQSDTDTKKKKKKAVTKKVVVKPKKVMTPRIPSRKIPLPEVVSPLQEAQSRLHVGAVPDSLPCREDEFAEIFSFTEGKIQEGSGGCMYISGLPGTGKTATVKEVIRTLEQENLNGELPDFKFIEINGMRLTEPNQSYVQIWESLTGQKATAEHARTLLEKRFTDPSSKKSAKTTVLLVDELDMLWNRKQSVLYNIFEWPTYKGARLIVLAIANTMDLPERVMINRVSSRVGLTRLTFSPYTHEQLTEIVAARLHGLSVFNKDAVQLVARKVSSLSGDARRALDICRRATEIAERQQVTQGKREENLVGMSHVTQAHKEMFCSPKMMAIRCCSPFEKMFLQSLVGIFGKTGIEETSFARTAELLSELSVVEGYKPVSITVAHGVLSRLVHMRLVLAEPGKSGRLDMKIRLNVSTDDVNFALKKEF